MNAELFSRATPVHGEAPWWDVINQELIWVDILGKVIYVCDSGGTASSFAVEETVGAAVRTSDGDTVALLQSGVARVAEAEEPNWVARISPSAPDIRFNDGKCDPAGRLVAGLMEFNGAAGRGSLVRIDGRGVIVELLTGLTIPNGLAWTADGSTMYFIDSVEGAIRSFRYANDDGMLDQGLLHASTYSPGIPDGMTIDSEGGLWVAMNTGGRVDRYNQRGELDMTVELPVSGATSCVFGGRDLDLLFITSSPLGLAQHELDRQPLAGSVFVAETGFRGAPEPQFLM